MEINKGFKYGQTLKKINLRDINTYVGGTKEKYYERFIRTNPLDSFLLNQDSNFLNRKFAKSFGDYSSQDGLQFNSSKKEREFLTNNTIFLHNDNENDNLQKIFTKRKSKRDFRNKNWSINDLDIIFGSLKEYPKKHRSYASAGDIYPINIYFYPFNIKNLEDKSVYKYQPISNSITKVAAKRTYSISDLFSIGNISNKNNIKLAIILVCDRRRIEFKYGDRGFIFSLIESGEISQILSLIAADKGYKLCLLGGYDQNKNNEILGIDGVTSFITCSIIMGS